MKGSFISGIALGGTLKLCRAFYDSEQQLFQRLTLSELVIVFSMAQCSNLPILVFSYETEEESRFKIKWFIFCDIFCYLAMRFGAHLFSC